MSSKVQVTRHIAKAYFIGALAVSFTHLITAGQKGGLTWEAWLIPFMVDGIALMGMVMRGEEFATRTRKIGFRTQMIAGALSLAGNVYAAHNIAGMVLGVAVVALFIFAEWLTDQIHSAADEAAEKLAQEAETKKAAAIAKGLETKAANKRAAANVVRSASKITRAAAKK